jgi:hypothetical protein
MASHFRGNLGDGYLNFFVMKYHFSILIIATQFMTGVTDFNLPSIAKSPISRGGSSVVNQAPALSLQAKINDLVAFSEVGLSIPQPLGFEKATSFHGFQQPATSSSVMLIVIPGPFAEVTKGFDKKGLATRGISLLSRQSIKIKNQPGLLLQVSQSAADLKFLKWIVVFGDAQKTNIVTATFLNENATKLSAPLKKIVLAVTPIPSTAPTVSKLPFNVTTVEGLVLVQKLAGLGKIAAFTKDGNIPAASPADPLFIVAPSLGAVKVGDQKDYATRRLSGYPNTDISTVQSTKEITIDNLAGWEIVADGQDKKSKTPLKIYQVMLFPPEGGYVLMTGIVGDKQYGVYVPKFKSIALSYRNSVK